MAEISTADTPETKVKFWAILAIVILVFAIIITMIDLGIKTAIIQESNSLKLFIERHTNGQPTARPDESRDNTNADNDPPLSGDVLAFNPTRMESGNVRQRSKARATDRGTDGRGNAPESPKGSA